jgi:hypothetical protein
VDVGRRWNHCAGRLGGAGLLAAERPRLTLILAAAFILTSCGSAGTVAAGGSGLYGTVRIAPATPVCKSGSSCSKPAGGFRLVFAGNGRTVTATTDTHGRYRVKLPGGRYAVRGARATLPKSGLQPKAVTVPDGRLAKRDFVFDSGIR